MSHRDPPKPHGAVAGQTDCRVASERRRLLLVGLAAGVSAVFYHSVMAAREVYPGPADYSYYYGLARNLRAGRGFSLDYTWHFLNVPRSIHNLPNDYWMPLAPILFAGAFFAFGTSLSAALTVCLVAWLGTAALAGLAARRLTGSAGLAAAAAVGTLVLPGMVSASLQTDGTALLALAGMAVFVSVLYADGRPWFYALAGACVGLAELSRQDGVLFGATVCVGVVTLGRGQRKVLAGSALLAYGLVMAPLFVANLRTFGAPLPPGLRKTAFLTTYEDLYSYGRLTASSYLHSPVHVLLAERWR